MKILLFTLLTLNLLSFFVYSKWQEPGHIDRPVTDEDPVTGKFIKKLIIPELDKANGNRSISSNHESVSDKMLGTAAGNQKPVQVVSIDKPNIVAEEPVAKKILGYVKDSSRRSKHKCVKLGPFVDKDDAFELNTQLTSLRIQSVLQSAQEQQKFWIFLQAKSKNQKPTALIRKLKSKGVKNFELITRRKKKFVISLGWYEKPDAASSRLEKLTGLGFSPMLEEKGSTGEMFWIEYEVPRGKKLSNDARSVIKKSRKESRFKSNSCG